MGAPLDAKRGAHRSGPGRPVGSEPSHIRNFLDCTRSRQRPRSDVEIAHRSTAMSMLGNIAYRTGHKLVWDAVKEECVGDADANAFLSRQYRAPWTL